MTTNDTNTPADRGRCSDIVETLRSVWRRLRTRLSKACGFFALTLFAIAACEHSVATPAAAAPCPGSVSLSWTITTGFGRPQTCAEVGARNVALRIQSRAGGAPVFTAFPCDSGRGTVNLPPGLYDVAIELHDAIGAKLATAPPETSVAVAVGRTRSLAPVSFVVGGGGGGGTRATVLLGIRSLGAGFNCQPTDRFGAGITGTSLTLTRTDGSCAVVTFDRLRANAVIDTYQVNCAAPRVVTCVELDEGLRTSELAPGEYDLRVVGKVGSADCWSATTSLEVPATGELQRTVFLEHQNLPGC